jgi:hypothetical protein
MMFGEVVKWVREEPAFNKGQNVHTHYPKNMKIVPKWPLLGALNITRYHEKKLHISYTTIKGLQRNTATL